MQPRIPLMCLLLAGLVGLPAAVNAYPVYGPESFTSPTVIDYRSSPAGTIPDGTPVTDQYASLGVVHDGHTTTPWGPPGMSSLSGLPGFEAGSGDLPGFIMNISFTIPVTQVGAFYLMGGATNSITLRAFAGGEELIESITVLPEEMPLRPGPYDFNEGFVGLITGELISAVQFESVDLAFVIDDLHFGIPEPGTLVLVVAGALATLRRRP